MIERDLKPEHYHDKKLRNLETSKPKKRKSSYVNKFADNSYNNEIRKKNS